MSGRNNIEGVYPTPAVGSVDEVARGNNALNFWREIPNFKTKAERLKFMKKEANRLTSLANKRVRRLEQRNLTDSPAYQQYIASGGKFSVRGKDYNQLQAEIKRLQTFINAETSTIKGYNNVLKEMANNTGIKYRNLAELRAKSKTFFELHSKIEQYLRVVDDIASAIGYQKIWQAINEYTKGNKIDLSQNDLDIDDMVETISDALKLHDEKFMGFNSHMWYELSDDTHL